MIYRERREARADRLRGWADTRTARATAALKIGESYRGDHAFNTQPGHIAEALAHGREVWHALLDAGATYEQATIAEVRTVSGRQTAIVDAVWRDALQAVEIMTGGAFRRGC